jgi:hypothetical protein
MKLRSNFAIASLAMVAIILACLPPLPAAAPPFQQGSNFTLEGKITEQSKGKLTVNMEGNIIMHVSYDAQTGIYRKDGSAGSANDLKVGTTVKVKGQLNASGVLEAQRIDLE